MASMFFKNTGRAEGRRGSLPAGWVWHWRDDSGKWETICPHGIGHDKGVHGCDGCCGILYSHPSQEIDKPRRAADIIQSLAEGKTLEVMGKKYSITRERVRQIFEKEAQASLTEIRLSQKKIKMAAKCEYCQKDYTRENINQHYCSTECRIEAHLYIYYDLKICTQCHLGFLRPRASKAKDIFCGKFCQGVALGIEYGWGSPSAHARQLKIREKKNIDFVKRMGKTFTVDDVVLIYGISNGSAYYKTKEAVLRGLIKGVRRGKKCVYRPTKKYDEQRS